MHRVTGTGPGRYADGGDGEGSQCRTERLLDGNDPGTYSATYTAKTAGTGLKANLTLGSVTAATPTLTPSRRGR
ncbi:hypothetical protein [Serratia odorifera]|uniref:hypothetical protein n=1 Tax=Serratia odorifera TaxID=618 RepID=UPI000FDCACF3|nr:hypothetical protein [Serratia odorifera]